MPPAPDRRIWWTVFLWDPVRQDILVAQLKAASEGLAYAKVRRDYGPKVTIGPIYRACLGLGIRVDRHQHDDDRAGAAAAERVA